VELHPIPVVKEAQSRASLAETPVTRKERAAAFARGPYPTPLERIPRVDETECVGCNLCSLVCPVDGCITMVEVDTGLKPETWDERTKGAVCVTQVQAP
jgi:dihydropyrimidine dehydrogenase (NAD+) subunit PreA